MTDNTMVDSTVSDETQQPDLKTLIGVPLLISFGITMLIMSLAYVQDVALLARAPELVWAFICGQPTDEGVALPILLLLSTVTITGGLGLLAWAWMRKRFGL